MVDSFETQGDPYELVEELEASCLLQDEGKLQAFSCACCRLIWDELPIAAQSALKVAEDYSKGLIPPEVVISERVKLWKYLGKESCDFSSAKVNAVRAVICSLFEHTPPHEAYDYARATMDFCNDVEDHQREQFELLREIFVGVS
jgi:hypothetical protein